MIFNNTIKLYQIGNMDHPCGQIPKTHDFLFKMTQNKFKYIFIKFTTYILFIKYSHIIPFVDRE